MHRTNNGRAIAGLALAGALLATGAQADTFCVKPSGGKCLTTIQAAVDAAAAGDKITISSGVYFENVDIPGGKDGLILSGSSSAILDAGDDGVSGTPNNGTGITVGSNGVVIQGITMRGGSSYHIEIASMVTGTWIEGVYSINPDDDAVRGGAMGNDDTTITKSTFLHTNGNVVELTGNRLHFIKNEVRHVIDAAIDASGDDVIVEGNTFVGVENGDAVTIVGDGAEVVKNTFRAIADAGIDIDGADALVSNNSLYGTYAGIEVDGPRLIVTNNKLQGTLGESQAIDVACDTDCTSAQVSNNKVQDTGDDTYHFEIDASAPGMLIAKNYARDGIDYGMELTVDGASLEKNRILSTGGDEEDCFDLNGDDNVMTGNIAVLCMGNGIVVDGDNNTLVGNKVAESGQNGFFVEAPSFATTLDGNSATDNGFGGIVIDDAGSPAANTVVTGNKALGNRHDYCDEGSGTTASDNKFGIVLAVTQNNTDDCPSF